MLSENTQGLIDLHDRVTTSTLTNVSNPEVNIWLHCVAIQVLWFQYRHVVDNVVLYSHTEQLNLKISVLISCWSHHIRLLLAYHIYRHPKLFYCHTVKYYTHWQQFSIRVVLFWQCSTDCNTLFQFKQNTCRKAEVEAHCCSKHKHIESIIQCSSFR